MEVVAKYPKAQAAAEAMFQAGSFQLKGGKADEAMKSFAQLLATYPYAKWVEDTLMAQAEVLTSRKDNAAAEKALLDLINEHGASNLASEAMLRLAALQVQRHDADAASLTCGEVRRKFPDTVEAVKALEALADIAKAGGKADAANLYKQIIDECQKLSEGKYVFFVNVQAVLKKISDSARAKMEGKPVAG
jgi:TolA-binding protein